MTISVKSKYLKPAICGAGFLAAALRYILCTTGTDRKGLLVSGHWAGICIWVLLAAVIALLVLGVQSVRCPKKYKNCYPASAAGAAGCVLLAGFLAINGFNIWVVGTGMMGRILPLACALSTLSLIRLGVCRLQREKPGYIYHSILCLTFCLLMLWQYRSWSSVPQIHEYLFPMGACVGLALTAYHLAAFDAGMGSHRAIWFFGLLTAFLSFGSVYGSESPLFTFSCGLWALTNLPRTKGPRKAKKAQDKPAEA